MNKYYFRFRIMLMTFTLGLASVFVFNGSLKFSDEIPVNLPKVKFESSTMIFCLPKNQSVPMMISMEKKNEYREFAAGASGGTTCEEAREKAKNKKIKIPNCE